VASCMQRKFGTTVCICISKRFPMKVGVTCEHRCAALLLLLSVRTLVSVLTLRLTFRSHCAHSVRRIRNMMKQKRKTQFTFMYVYWLIQVSGSDESRQTDKVFL
jgi:hypothetical protein